MSATVELARWVVTVDIPDPDNFLMVYQMLNNKQKRRMFGTVAVILSPRPVCFAAAPYGKKYQRLLNAIDRVCQDEEKYQTFPTGVRRLLSPITPGDPEEARWIREMEGQDQAWFYRDPDFSDIDVRNDTQLYMEVSALRLICYLDTHRISRDDYRLFWGPQAMRNIIPGIRHAFHVPDFTWGFDQAKLSRYEKAIANNVIDDSGNVKDVLSESLRTSIIELCEEYVESTSTKVDTQRDSFLHDLSELLNMTRVSSDTIDIFVGGPLTEALVVCESGNVRSITAMGGFIHGKSNLFANQFNFAVDMSSAHKILDLADADAFMLTLLPTECVKNDILALTGTELRECLQNSPATLELVQQSWHEFGQLQARYAPFDWVLGLTVTHPDLFPKRRVSKKGDEVIRFEPDASGRIFMFWNNEEHIKKCRGGYFQALKDAFDE